MTGVLVVDDTPDLRLLLRMVFESEQGFTVVGEAGDGRAGVELARVHQPDVVLLDLAMPVMDGLEALPLLRAELPRSAIVVLSGFSRSAVVDDALALGADAYVQKGADPGQIVDEVRAALVCRRGSAAVPGPRPAEPQPRPEPEPAPSEGLSLAAVATIVHELQNPVTAISGLAMTLDRRWDRLTPGQRADLLQGVVRQSRRLELHVRDLLSGAQAAAGQLRVDLTPTRVVDAVAGALGNLLDPPPVEVAVPDDLVVWADPLRLDQVLTNYLTNALKYGAAPYAVAAVAEGDTVLIEVRDGGAGVPEQLVPMLFQQYRRAEGTGQPGTGLGLFVVRAAARAQGGDAWYAPSRPRGSSFCVRLRRAEIGVSAA